jgi:hypothetical protein
MLTTDISTSFVMKKETVAAFLDISGAYVVWCSKRSCLWENSFSVLELLSVWPSPSIRVYNFEPIFVQLTRIWYRQICAIGLLLLSICWLVTPRASGCLCLGSDGLLVTQRFFSLLGLTISSTKSFSRKHLRLVATSGEFHVFGGIFWWWT